MARSCWLACANSAAVASIWRDFALELGGIGADLLGLAGEPLQLVDADRLAGDDARHERPRRGGADVGREPLLDLRDQLVAGDAPARSPLPPRPKIWTASAGPRMRSAIRRRSATRAMRRMTPELAFGLAAEDVDEERRLEAGERRRLARASETPTKSSDVDEHAPEEGMHQRVESGEAEERVGPQPRPAERPVVDDARPASGRSRRSSAGTACRPRSRSPPTSPAKAPRCVARRQ